MNHDCQAPTCAKLVCLKMREGKANGFTDPSSLGCSAIRVRSEWRAVDPLRIVEASEKARLAKRNDFFAYCTISWAMYNPATEIRTTKTLHERYWEVPRLLGSVVGLRG